MPFERILGQPTAVTTLVRALESGRLHHAYRFEGPEGVGRELAAVAFAQALLCTAGVRLGCGTCDACRRAATFSPGDGEGTGGVPLHPDFVVVERGLYSAEALGRSTAEVRDISVDQVRRLVIARAGYPPHEGRARVFLVRRAEELGQSAANALLKALEEPRPSTHFVLLTSAPERLLDTIRSRTLPVRFGPLSDEVLCELCRARGLSDEATTHAIELASGSIAAALAAADPELVERRGRFIREARASIEASDYGLAAAFAEALERDRDRLLADLGALAADFVQEARAHAGSEPRRAERAARRHALVLQATQAVARNGSASLAWLGLVAAMRRL
ncbi:MAG: DNA polymerase III subunit delta' [Polyangiaceae bacterium]|nr:DNA polymerase III subunit delta' [Polyangiaceae bacterium]